MWSIKSMPEISRWYNKVDVAVDLESGGQSQLCEGGRYKMPESFRAFWRMVSLTAAKTSRIFDVSVACVRLKEVSESALEMIRRKDSLRVEVQMCSVHLIKAPQQILRRSIDVVATGIVGKVVGQGRLLELRPEQVHFVEEQDDRCSHEPS
jgi:hypothetical protein